MNRITLIVLALCLTLPAAILPAEARSARNALAGETVYVVIDPDDAELEAAHARPRRQVANWMGPDMVRILQRLNKTGLQAQLLQNADEFTPAGNAHLLIVRIENYNPGSKAARVVVGMGAGGVVLDVAYTLATEKNATPRLNGEDGTFSGRDWQYAARKLNQNIAQKVIAELSGTGDGR